MLAAAKAVSRKSKGDVSSGGSSGDAYSVPAKSEASDQSAGEAARTTSRARTTVTAVIPTPTA